MFVNKVSQGAWERVLHLPSTCFCHRRPFRRSPGWTGFPPEPEPPLNCILPSPPFFACSRCAACLASKSPSSRARTSPSWSRRPSTSSTTRCVSSKLLKLIVRRRMGLRGKSPLWLQYIRNYVSTGEAKVLNVLRDLMGMHRDRYVFEMKLLVRPSRTPWVSYPLWDNSQCTHTRSRVFSGRTHGFGQTVCVSSRRFPFELMSPLCPPFPGKQVRKVQQGGQDAFIATITPKPRDSRFAQLYCTHQARTRPRARESLLALLRSNYLGMCLAGHGSVRQQDLCGHLWLAARRLLGSAAQDPAPQR